jgi:hypothetical protein
MKERLKYSEMTLKGVETLAVVAINERNRLAIAFRQVPGSLSSTRSQSREASLSTRSLGMSKSHMLR